MKTRSLIIAGVVSGLVMATLLRAAPEAAPAKVTGKLAKAKAEAARKTYEVFWKDYKEGLVPVVEVVYRWSKRWLHAELELTDKKADQLAAYQAHGNRIRELARVARDRYRVRTNTIEEVTSTEFYGAEAEAWIEEAKNKKP
jgi:hypothetical protein